MVGSWSLIQDGNSFGYPKFWHAPRPPMPLASERHCSGKLHIFIRFEVKHYRPADRPKHIYVINWETGTGEWEPLFDDNGEPLYPTLIKELDEIKTKRPTGGLMLRRDGTGRSWVGKDEQLTQVERKCREIIDAAGLPPIIDANGDSHP